MYANGVVLESSRECHRMLYTEIRLLIALYVHVHVFWEVLGAYLVVVEEWVCILA